MTNLVAVENRLFLLCHTLYKLPVGGEIALYFVKHLSSVRKELFKSQERSAIITMVCVWLCLVFTNSTHHSPLHTPCKLCEEMERKEVK